MIILLSIWLAIALGGCGYLFWLRKHHTVEDRPMLTGYSVEVDCRRCGQFNRVPQERLRDRPKCGKCKARLMPRMRVTLCRVTSMEANMKADINKVWDDEDRLWSTLADHVTLKTKDDKNEKYPNLKIVN